MSRIIVTPRSSCETQGCQLTFFNIHTAFILRPCKNRDHSSSEERSKKNNADGVRSAYILQNVSHRFRLHACTCSICARPSLLDWHETHKFPTASRAHVLCLISPTSNNKCGIYGRELVYPTKKRLVLIVPMFVPSFCGHLQYGILSKSNNAENRGEISLTPLSKEGFH